MPGTGLDSPLRVLVVDDCPDTTATMSMLLRVWGHDVCIAHDGPSALAFAAEYCPEVVLLDIGLPGMDGFAVARHLRARVDSGRPLIVSISGFGRDVDRAHALEAGCDQHWVKPIEPDRLRDLLAARRRARAGRIDSPFPCRCEARTSV